MYRLVLVGVLAASGCGSRCKDVKSARTALVHAGAAGRTADVRVAVPLARANTLFAEILREPLSVPLDPPELGPVTIDLKLAAVVRELQLQPGEPGKLRFATRVEVREPDSEVVTLALVGEIAPKLERNGDDAFLVIGLGPENVVSLDPTLEPNAQRTVDGAIDRWVGNRIPAVLRGAAAGKLRSYLLGAGYDVIRRKLLTKLGEVTRLRLRLPDVPIATFAIRSTQTSLVVDILTDLPVRAGLAPSGEEPEIGVRMSGSAVAELANWAIEHGRAPRSYNRTVEPKSDGEFRPYFDYVAADRAHPFKVYSFQERGGCSFHKVGVRASMKIAGDQLVVTALDRELEGQSAHPVIEAAAWTKYFVFGSLNRSKAIAAHTRLAVGGRTLDTRVVSAAIENDEVHFALQLSAGVERHDGQGNR